MRNLICVLAIVVLVFGLSNVANADCTKCANGVCRSGVVATVVQDVAKVVTAPVRNLKARLACRKTCTCTACAPAACTPVVPTPAPVVNPTPAPCAPAACTPCAPVKAVRVLHRVHLLHRCGC